MELKTLFSGYSYSYNGPAGGLRKQITGLSYDSRTTRPGELYFCLDGIRVDGHLFAGEAVKKGAAGIVASKPLYIEGMPVLQVSDSRNALSFASDIYFGKPSSKMNIIGVTGTNGKTTTAHLLQAIYRFAGKKCGTIGTVGINTGFGYKQGSLTTPEAPDLHSSLRDMLDENIINVVMEVSSHALINQRVEHISFSTAIFTNLSRDHLDFHKTMEDYFRAKSKLFMLLESTPRGKTAIINSDDSFGLKLAEDISLPVLTYGLNKDADFKGTVTHTGINGTSLQVAARNGSFNMKVHLPGRFNAYNALAAASAAVAEGISFDDITAGIDSLKKIPGRLESVVSKEGVNVFIDFAHTPDGLEEVLKALKEVPHRRMITVFGCPGERDKGKRPLMGRIAETYSDIVVLTSDNPASESPETIIADILQGMSTRPEILPARDLAVQFALSLAEKGDIVLLAGKGHETYQIIGNEKIPYSDHQAVASYMKH